MGPLDKGKPWSKTRITGMLSFIKKLWSVLVEMMVIYQKMYVMMS
ncbi:MAG: hypothetical protein CM1200mP33_0950 [Chloroflexota bacterium]|nr:MAG: hypothetical protein CM1200mP33_0950 [Chloroflexota bacterium]